MTLNVDQLVLKRASASRPSGEWDDEDFDVLADGVVVGRIYSDASASTPPELRWFWSILLSDPRHQEARLRCDTRCRYGGFSQRAGDA